LLGVLRKVEGRGRHESAKRIRAICSQVFRYGIATARADRDVAADLRGALIVPKVTHRPAITTPNEAGALLRAIESFVGHPTTDIALKLLPHVFARPGELRHAEWADFDFDRSIWIIPAHKTKMRRVHSVPLSRQALAIIATIEFNADYSSYLFPSLRSTKRPMSENTINAALRRLGYSMAATGAACFCRWRSKHLKLIAHRIPEPNIERTLSSFGVYWLLCLPNEALAHAHGAK
jgi:integrase